MLVNVVFSFICVIHILFFFLSKSLLPDFLEFPNLLYSSEIMCVEASSV